MDQVPESIEADRESVNFGQVVGENVQRIRAELGMSQSVLARLLSVNGDRWTKGNVAALERGARKQVTDAELAQLAATFNVKLAELYQGEGDLRIGENALISREDWRSALAGEEPPTVAVLGADAVAGPMASMSGDFLAVEIADRLGTSINDVAKTARRLYGRSVTAEQARRVGPVDDPTSQSTAVRRGNVTRQLTAEIRQELEKKA